MAQNITTLTFINFAVKMAWSFVYLAHTHLLKTVKPNVKYVQLITSYAPSSLTHQCHHIFGIMHFKWPHIYSTYYLASFLTIKPLPKYYTIEPHRMTTFTFLVACVIHCFLPQPSISYNPVQHLVCSQDTLRIIKVTNAMTQPLTK